MANTGRNPILRKKKKKRNKETNEQMHFENTGILQDSL